MESIYESILNLKDLNKNLNKFIFLLSELEKKTKQDYLSKHLYEDYAGKILLHVIECDYHLAFKHMQTTSYFLDNDSLIDYCFKIIIERGGIKCFRSFNKINPTHFENAATLETSFLKSIRFLNYKASLFLLSKYNIDIESNNYYALRFCAEKGNLLILKKLLKMGADINAEDSYCIKAACNNRNQKIIEFILERFPEQEKAIYNMHFINEKTKIEITNFLLNYKLGKTNKSLKIKV